MIMIMDDTKLIILNNKIWIKEWKENISDVEDWKWKKKKNYD